MGPKKTTCAVPTRISPPDHQARPTNPSPEHYEFDRRQKLESLCALGMIRYDHVPFQSFPTVTPCLGVGQALAWSDWLRDRWADLQGLTWLIWTSLWIDGLLSLPHLPSSISQHLMIFHGLRGRLHQDPVLQLIVAAARSRHDPRAHNHWIVQRKREVIEIDWSMVNPELQRRVGHKFPIWRSGESEKPFWVNVILPLLKHPQVLVQNGFQSWICTRISSSPTARLSFRTASQLSKPYKLDLHMAYSSHVSVFGTYWKLFVEESLCQIEWYKDNRQHNQQPEFWHAPLAWLVDSTTWKGRRGLVQYLYLEQLRFLHAWTCLDNRKDAQIF